MGYEDDSGDGFTTFVDCLLRLQDYESTPSVKQTSMDNVSIGDSVLVSAAPNGNAGFYFSRSAGLVYAARNCIAGDEPIGQYTGQVFIRLRKIGHKTKQRQRTGINGLNLCTIVKNKAVDIWSHQDSGSGNRANRAIYIPKKKLTMKIGLDDDTLAAKMMFRGLKVSVAEFKAMVEVRTNPRVKATAAAEYSKPATKAASTRAKEEIQPEVHVATSGVRRFNLFPTYTASAGGTSPKALSVNDYDIRDLTGLEPILEPIVTSFGVLDLS